VKVSRIALVEAASPLTHVYSRVILPRVGIPTIAAIMTKLGYRTDVFFQSERRVTAEELRGYDIVGIGTLTNTAPAAYELADAVRGSATVVMGGPHPTFMPEEALAHADYVVLVEGEDTFPALVRVLESGGDRAGVNGIAYRNGTGEVHKTPPAARVDYASLPSPDFTLARRNGRSGIPPIVVTSRGCPHDCCFCSVTSLYGRRYRFKSTEQVLSEVRPVVRRSVNVGDDNFCANPGRAKELLREMIARDLVPKRWSCQCTVGAASDDELLELMRRTRCRMAYIGIESVRPETLAAFGKAHEVEAIAGSIENFHRHDIGVHGMFVVSMDDPVDTPHQIVDYALRHDIDTIQVFALTPFPGTPSFRQLEGRLLHREWQYFDGMHVVVRPSTCTPYELQVSLIGALNRFYSLGHALSSYRRRRGWRVKYRLGGHFNMRRLTRENRGYVERLRRMG